MGNSDDPTGEQTLSPAETAEYMETFLAEAVRPHAETLAVICARGDIAVVAYDLASPLIKRFARDAGWDGSGRPWGMPEAVRAAYLAKALATGDGPTRRWFAREGTLRLFGFWGHGTILLNHEVDVGWSLEPESTGMRRRS